MKSVIDRIFEKVSQTDSGCIEYTGSTCRSGYGTVKDGGKMRLVHRVVFEEFVSKLGERDHIDHLCRNRRCCNTSHVEPVSQEVNNRRAAGWSFDGVSWTCANGHDPMVRPIVKRGKRPHIECRECANMRRRRS